MNVLNPIANDPLVQIFVALEQLMSPDGFREHDGIFQSSTPRLVFEAAFLEPYMGSIDPLETWGVAQRLVHSKDGKIWRVVDGEILRVAPDVPEHKAACLVAEARRLGIERDTWPTFVLADGSFFPPSREGLPGALLPAPGPIRLVSLDEYTERLSDHFEAINKAYEERDLTRFDSATFEDVKAQIVPSRPDSERLCRHCGRTLTKPETLPDWVTDRFDPQYVLECVPCGSTSYQGPIPEPHPGASALLDELNAKILEEFPVFDEGLDDEDD